MSYNALYRKYRPSRFCEVVGQEHITEVLKNQIRSGRFAHAYLFSGSRGTGKTSTARILARAINCLDPVDGEPCLKCEACLKNLSESIDVIELDAASNSGVDQMRSIIEKAEFAPINLKTKIYIIDEAHMLSRSAENALLKTLEEPPEGMVIMILSENSEELLPTINSRCVNIRLYDAGGADRSEGADEAEKIFRIIMEKAYFADVKAELDKAVRTRQDAYMLLDGMESLVGSIARGRSDISMTPAQAEASTELIEETRRDIKLGAGYNYRIRGLVLRLGEIIE